tara:strand:- start:578 stop:736 length:159 start_codon:yes stop_codon:yes gene_type:complete
MEQVDLKQAALFIGGLGLLNILGTGYLATRRVNPNATMELTRNFIKNMKNKV